LCSCYQFPEELVDPSEILAFSSWINAKLEVMIIVFHSKGVDDAINLQFLFLFAVGYPRRMAPLVWVVANCR
jgi:hypothetical protein